MEAQNNQKRFVKSLCELNNKQLAYYIASIMNKPVGNLIEYCDASAKMMVPKRVSSLFGFRRWWGWWGCDKSNLALLKFHLDSALKILREYSVEDYRSRSTSNELALFFQVVGLESPYQLDAFYCFNSLEFLDAVVDFRGYDNPQKSSEHLIESDAKAYVDHLLGSGLILDPERVVEELNQSVDLFVNSRCRNIFN